MRVLLALVAVSFLLVGCGGEGNVAKEDRGLFAQPTPTWPTTGCREHSMANIDYVSDASGAATREEAAARYMEDGDRLVREGPQPPHYRRGWVVVTPGNEIRAVLTMFKGENGFLVDSVENCAH